jgi:asparagine synthase (glutamine-hydrolysing)
MCGFVGMVALNGAAVDPQVISKMSAVIRHRGPDDEGSYITGPVGFGFRRLAILDLSPTGHQPMESQDGQVVLVFNGEIYNYVRIAPGTASPWSPIYVER